MVKKGIERERKRREEEQRRGGEQKQKEVEQVPNDYHPLSSIYDPTHKEDNLPISDPKMKQALVPDYYPPNYVPKQGEDVSIAINQISAASASSIMHVMANHQFTIDGAYYVYMHLHL